MNLRKKILIPLALVTATAAALPFAAQAMDGGPHCDGHGPRFGMRGGMDHFEGGMRMPPFIRELKLTEAQRDQIFKIMHEQAPAIRDKAKEARKALARLEIERNTALSAEEKRKALAETEAQLPAPLRAQRSESVAHVGAAQQTAAFNAQGADDATRFAQRSATYGAEAAERLARLDREERDWNARLDQYQQARSAGQDAARLDQLRQTLFTPEEQLRLEGALGLRSPAQNR